jgi:hypothetical protein
LIIMARTSEQCFSLIIMARKNQWDEDEVHLVLDKNA